MPDDYDEERQAEDTTAADEFNAYCNNHSADIDLLTWAKENQVSRRAFEELRTILRQHYDCEVPGMAEMGDALLAVGHPLEAKTTEHTYRIHDQELRRKLPHSVVTWESCSIADSIRQERQARA